MKKSIYILLLFSLICTWGCDEDLFLKEDPRDAIYAENLLVNYTGFQSMVTALHGLMRNEYRRADANGVGSIPVSQHAVFAAGADNAWANNASQELKFLYKPSEIRKTDLAVFEGTFLWLYKIINTANMIISRAERTDVNWEGTTEIEDQANKDDVAARARFFRAWAYRHLTYAYGAVPLSTEEISGLNYRTDWERNPVSEIRGVMEEDWTFAVNKLPLRETNNNVISGAMARHYLGELYLATDRVDDAIAVLKPLVEGNDYALMTSPFGKKPATPACPFIDVFTTPAFKDGNREVLFYFVNTEPTVSAYGVPDDMYIKSSWKNYYVNDAVIKKSNLNAPEYTSNTLTHPQVFWLNNGGKGAGRVAVSLGSIRLYNYKNMGKQDMRINEPAFVWKIYEKDATGNIVEFLNKGVTPIDTTLTSAMLDDNRTTIQNYKWPSTRKWDYVQQVPTSGEIDATYADVVYLRLSDTYLLYAEAQYKKNNPDESIKWINKVRDRANAVAVTATDLSAGKLDLILDERSRELLAEEERRHTLIRVSQENGGDERAVENYFKRRSRQYNEVAGRDARGMNTYEVPVLFPLPQVFIDSNTGRVLENNPGY
ncbi:MAG: RagB/SusD family nutrient uptake outer membrane protein [Mediterranea sp.]|jgi:hypothetical protein|nr:RagB/SusD family nutrient uptake outer membrane protein [Mediterranea sp.]